MKIECEHPGPEEPCWSCRPCLRYIITRKDAETDSLKAEMKKWKRLAEALQDQVPCSGRGECDNCGRVPSVNIPTSLCDVCVDGVARARSAEEESPQWKRRFEWVGTDGHGLYYSDTLSKWVAFTLAIDPSNKKEWYGNTPEEAVDKAIAAEEESG